MNIQPLLGVLAATALVAGANAQTVTTVTTNGLFEPYGVAVDLATNVYYFTDSANSRVIRFNPATREFLTHSSFIFGTEHIAGFPEGIVPVRGGLAVSDSIFNDINFVSLQTGSISLIAGSTRGFSNGTGGNAQFNAPSGLAADSNDNIYVADLKNDAIRRIAPDNQVTTYATGFNQPAGVAVGEGGRVFVADTMNHVIKVIEPDRSVRIIAGRLGISGAVDGDGSLAEFDRPRGLVWVGGETGLLVTDSGNHTIRRVFAVDDDWQVATLTGQPERPGFVNGGLDVARFNFPVGLAVDAEGSILIADLYNKALRSIQRVVPARPVIVPIGGSFSNTISVTVTTAVPNTILRFTTDGSEPTPVSDEFTGTLALDQGPVLLKVRGFSPDFATTPTVSNLFSFFVNPLSVSVPGGIFTNDIDLAISTLTAGAAIRFTTDGTLPTTNSPVFVNGPFNTSGLLLVQGFREGFTPSPLVSNRFTFVVSPVFISPPGATTNNTVQVTLGTGTERARIHWTIDGSEPTPSSPLYTEPFVLGTNGIFKARGFRAGYTDSPISAALFNFIVANPVITPASAVTNNQVLVTITSETQGAELYWTIDGTGPSRTNGFRYTDSFFLGTNGVLKVKGFKNGFVDSATVNGVFNLTVATPTISPAGATTNNAVQIVLNSDTEDARIYWTINGTEPGPGTGFLYTEPFLLTQTGTLRVKGFKDGFRTSPTASAQFNLSVASPVISPAGATTNNAVSVTLSSVTQDAEIFWTIDGSDPSRVNGVRYTGLPFLLGTNGLLRVRAFRTGFTDSQIVSASFNLSVAAPVISPAGATANNPVTVTLSSATENAEIYWTINGSEPSRTNGARYTGAPFDLGTNGTLRVKAFRQGFVDSPTVNATFNLSVANPVISPASATTNNPVLISLSSDTFNAQLFWTINGSEPSRTNGFPYTAPFFLTNSGTLRVKGFKDGFVPSLTMSGNFSLTADTPVISPNGATANNPVEVTLTTSTADADIFWTINGSEPSRANGFRYTGPFVLATNGVLKAKTFRDGFVSGPSASATFNLSVATPVISPPGANATNNVLITLTTATQNAELYWTIDGSDPSRTNGVRYTGPFSLGTNGVLRVKGIKDGFVDSPVATATFNLTVANPTIVPAGATSDNLVLVTLLTGTTNAVIFWTIDGSEPTTSSFQYTGPFLLGTNGTLKAKAFQNGFVASGTVSAVFNLKVGRPSITPPAGTNINTVTITLAASTTNATIRYTIDGAEPGANSPAYTGPFTMVTNTLLKVGAFLAGFVPSDVVSNDYKIQVDRPVISPGSGFFPNGTIVTITVARTNAVIFYTLNGQDPTTNDTLYTGPFMVNQISAPGTDLRLLKARAFAPHTLPSEIASGQPVETNAIGVPRDIFAGQGATIVVPVVINMATTNLVRSLQFRIQLSPNTPTAPPITNELRLIPIGTNDFVPIVGPGVPGAVVNFATTDYRDGVTNGLTVSAIGTNANLLIQNFAALGLLAVKIPGTASTDDSYRIDFLEPSATSDGQQKTVPLSALPSRIIDVQNIPYLLGDSSLGAWYNAGDFGDGKLDNSDVNNAFYASLGIRLPYPFTDVFDSMDTFPTDTPGTVGGDGQIRFLDWQRILNRSLRRDPSNFNRVWSSGIRVATPRTLPGAAASPAEEATLTGASEFWVRQAALGAAVVSDVQPGQTVDVPVFLKVAPGSAVSGMQFRTVVQAEGEAPALQQAAAFISTGNIPVPQSADGLPQNEVVSAWNLNAFVPALQGSNQMGVVRFVIPPLARAGDSYTIHFLYADGSPDENTQYDLESLPGSVWVQSAALGPVNQLSSEWKAHYFGTGSSEVMADADPDQDGQSNWKEYLAGTSPIDPGSRLALLAPERTTARGVVLRWLGAPGKRYTVEGSSDLGQWSVVGASIVGTGGVQEFADDQAAGARFYRIRIEQ